MAAIMAKYVFVVFVFFRIFLNVFAFYLIVENNDFSGILISRLAGNHK